MQFVKLSLCATCVSLVTCRTTGGEPNWSSNVGYLGAQLQSCFALEEEAHNIREKACLLADEKLTVSGLCYKHST